MAKYCAKCGKALPDGVDVCPDCHAVAQEDGAAPFTRITAETEVWKSAGEKPKKERQKKTRTQKQIIGLSIAAAAVLALVIFLIIYIQPVNRVIRYIRGGEYDQAVTLYWSSASLSSGAHDERIQRTALQAAEEILDAYAAHTVGSEEAAAALSKLGTFGEGAETLLADVYAAFRAYNASQDHMAEAKKLTLNGEHLAAREEYLLVMEGDLDYDEARSEAEASFDRYADSVLAAADVLIQTGDYASAIETLEDGERALLDYEVYSEKLDYKLNATYELFEKDLLASAAELAALEDYASAAEKLRQNMERFDYATPALTEALESYLDLAQDKALADAVERAERLYDQGSYAEAFAELDEFCTLEDVKTEEAEAAVAALEARFADDRIAAAKETFANDRETLPDAVELLEEALKIRELEPIRTYLEDISAYLPVSLAELMYVSKEGTLLRYTSTGSTAFDGLDGTTYKDGWLWGEDGAAVTFALSGGYDLLEAVFTVREGREEDAEVSGCFEIVCDGETVYTSETLDHTASEPLEVSVDISGCEVLTIRFVNDYTVSTAEGGYCYHGLCSPTITKNLPND